MKSVMCGENTYNMFNILYNTCFMFDGIYIGHWGIFQSLQIYSTNDLAENEHLKMIITLFL